MTDGFVQNHTAATPEEEVHGSVTLKQGIPTLLQHLVEQ